MREISPNARTLAGQALRHQAAGQREPAALAEVADHAYGRLRDRLTGLIGHIGYGTLVARAVRLAQAEVPALEGLAVDAWAEDSVHQARGFALASPADLGAATDGLTAILAHIIGLLITFIGEDLAVRLVREAWPELAPGPQTPEGHA